MTIISVGPFGANFRTYGGEPQSHAVGESYFLLDGLAAGGQNLTIATAELGNDLFHAFNTVGQRQIDRTGVLQKKAWGSEWPYAARWAAETGIPTNPPAA